MGKIKENGEQTQICSNKRTEVNERFEMIMMMKDTNVCGYYSHEFEFLCEILPVHFHLNRNGTWNTSQK